jgi:hypothetical protein
MFFVFIWLLFHQTGSIVGIVIGSLVLVVGVAGLVFMWYNKGKVAGASVTKSTELGNIAIRSAH